MGSCARSLRWSRRSRSTPWSSGPCSFAELEQELRLHGAPRSLVARTQRARRDEVRHARQMAVLARRYGARSTPLTVRSTPPRPLIEVAEANALEGCVRETFGALVAFAQARAWDRLEPSLTRAAPPEVQRVAGMPDAARLRRWYRGMRDRVR